LKHKITFSALFVALAMMMSPAAARDTAYHFKIADVKADPRYTENVPNDITFSFSDHNAGTVASSYGEFVTNRKTNSVGRPDEEVCRWAMISAMKELAGRARTEGGNAVINIVSYYKKNVFSSATEYECHAGAIIAGVALKGTVVKLSK
jgi:uncharacterized protein YbjQ (UPF0145 family)